MTLRLSGHFKRNLRWSTVVAAGALVLLPSTFGRAHDRSPNPYDFYYIASQGSNQLMHYDENTGRFLGVLFEAPGAGTTEIGFDGDLFMSAHASGDVHRFDGFTGAYKGVFIHAGSGGLTAPAAPGMGPDNLLYVGDSVTNQVVRFDAQGNFVDVIADPATSPVNAPFMETFDDTTMFVASGGTNSVLRYDIRTRAYLGAFVAPGSGGLVYPIGLEIGPDGNVYVSSNGTGAILRYDGKTGAFMDTFVPAGTAGMSNVKAIRFGGPNSNLYAVSSGNNQVVEFDRVTGAFVRVVADGTADGMSNSRGLTFTARPAFNVYASIEADDEPGRGDRDAFSRVVAAHRVLDFSDPSPRVRLVSIVYSDPDRGARRSTRHADLGDADYDFELDMCNESGVAQHYTITYTATNHHDLTTFATTDVPVPPKACGRADD